MRTPRPTASATFWRSRRARPATSTSPTATQKVSASCASSKLPTSRDPRTRARLGPRTHTPARNSTMPRYCDDYDDYHVHVHRTGGGLGTGFGTGCGCGVGVLIVFALLVLGLFAGLVAMVVGVASLG